MSDPFDRGLRALIRELGREGAAAWIEESHRRKLQLEAKNRLQRGVNRAMARPRDARGWLQVAADGLAGFGAIIQQSDQRGPSLDTVVDPEPIQAEFVDWED